MTPRGIRRRTISATIVAALALAGCGSTDGDAPEGDQAGSTPVAPAPTTPTTPGAPTSDSSGPVATSGADPTAAPDGGSPAVPEVLQFQAPLLGGGTFDGAAYAGTPLVLWFWAPT